MRAHIRPVSSVVQCAPYWPPLCDGAVSCRCRRGNVRTQHNGVGLAWMSPVLLKEAEILSLCSDRCSVSRMLQLLLTSLVVFFVCRD